jgi:ketosteroid isomerase-like protein
VLPLTPRAYGERTTRIERASPEWRPGALPSELRPREHARLESNQRLLPSQDSALSTELRACAESLRQESNPHLNRTKGACLPLTLRRLECEKTWMGTEPRATPRELVERLHEAMNRHDLEAFLACVDADYQSEQPVHPARGFGGRDQVEKNWSTIFEGIPDFHADLLGSAVDGDTVWCEWHWFGSRANEAPLDMRGVTLFRIEKGRIVSGRLYMEEVEAGGDIDESVRRLTEG